MDVSKSAINILLLGETGVGKSTFINSFANYFEHETFEAAVESELLCLIPTKFTFTDEKFKERHVIIGKDKNEDPNIGKSSTKGPKSYAFPMEGDERIIRLIDTPGIGDSKGVAQDNENFENILDYISQCDYLHAICFLLKPNASVINPYFKFCLLHLLMRLEKSAAHNIIFVFTNTRTTFYKPGETLTNIRSIFEEVRSKPPYVEIPCDERNIFCMDNEAFRFLVALKDGVQFNEEEVRNYSASWALSVKTCRKMIESISGNNTLGPVTPHLVKNTLSVNEARKMIQDLSKPLVDISENIQHNLTSLQRHRTIIARSGQSIEEFEKNLYVPVINILKKELDNPAIICVSDKCTERLIIGDNVIYHYKQKCHYPCSLQIGPREHIGDKALLSCWAMQGSHCRVCGCSFTTHMHIYYETVKVDAQEVSITVKRKINSAQDQIRIQNEFIEELENKSKEYEEEKDKITKALARFAYFLKENSIAIFNDAYEEYLNYLIARENQFGRNSRRDVLDRHVALKKEYIEQKELLEILLRNKVVGDSSSAISASEIQVIVSELYALRHAGKKIEELYKAQQKARSKEHESNVEYHHPKFLSQRVKKGLRKFTGKVAKYYQSATSSSTESLSSFGDETLKTEAPPSLQNETLNTITSSSLEDKALTTGSLPSSGDKEISPNSKALSSPSLEDENSKNEASTSLGDNASKPGASPPFDNMDLVAGVLAGKNSNMLPTEIRKLIEEEIKNKLASMTLSELMKLTSDHFHGN